MNGPQADPWRILTGLLTAAVIALASWVWTTQATLTKIAAQADVDAKQDDVHEEQNERIQRFWKLHGWSKDEINQLRALHELDMSKWPD